jgi:hypothetical protein
MDPVAGAKSAASTLKGAQAAGKELGSVVTGQQADMEAAVQQQHQARLRAKAAETQRQAMLEFQAVKKYEAEKAREREVEKLRIETIARFGKNAWSEVQSVKARMEKERQEENRYMDRDRDRQAQAFWWCMTAAALVTYFFKLYK